VWKSGYMRKLANHFKKPCFLIYLSFSNKLKFSRGLMALATLNRPLLYSPRSPKSPIAQPHPHLGSATTAFGSSLSVLFLLPSCPLPLQYFNYSQNHQDIVWWVIFLLIPVLAAHYFFAAHLWHLYD